MRIRAWLVGLVHGQAGGTVVLREEEVQPGRPGSAAAVRALASRRAEGDALGVLLTAQAAGQSALTGTVAGQQSRCLRCAGVSIASDHHCPQRIDILQEPAQGLNSWLVGDGALQWSAQRESRRCIANLMRTGKVSVGAHLLQE